MAWNYECIPLWMKVYDCQLQLLRLCWSDKMQVRDDFVFTLLYMNESWERGGGGCVVLPAVQPL